jgi:hypothetical protein
MEMVKYLEFRILFSELLPDRSVISIILWTYLYLQRYEVHYFNIFNFFSNRGLIIEHSTVNCADMFAATGF